VGGMVSSTKAKDQFLHDEDEESHFGGSFYYSRAEEARSIGIASARGAG
jgi:hypothetical protein